MTFQFHRINDFLPAELIEELRHQIEASFLPGDQAADPNSPKWAAQRLEGGALRIVADAEHFFPPPQIERLRAHLGAWSRDRFGMPLVEALRVEMIFGGIRPARHNTAKGRYAAALDLSPSGADRECLFITADFDVSGPIVQGALAFDSIWPALQGGLKVFFERHQEAIAAAMGRLVFKVHIARSGAVSEIECVVDDLEESPAPNNDDPALVGALRAALTSCVFPNSTAETILTMPLVFGDRKVSGADQVQNAEFAILEKMVEARPREASLHKLIYGSAMDVGNLRIAGDFANRFARLTRGTKFYRPAKVSPLAFPKSEEAPFVTPAKIGHDLQQMRYLLERGRLPESCVKIADDYEAVLKSMAHRKISERIPLSEIDCETVREYHGRILHVRDTPRLPQGALSTGWDRAAAQDEYLAHPFGLLVIDNFLTEEALREVRQFCLESTVWFGHRYGQGRLGAFFKDGFNCPLLLQIAEEIQVAFPRLIRPKDYLQQLWAYRYAAKHRRGAPHADFAAVNVNFWVGPDEANRDKSNGGLIVYNAEAPKDWSFDDYNVNGKKISQFIEETKPSSTKITYKENRAIIFNSDLFHATDNCDFIDEFSAARTNVTMLYGTR